MKKKRKKNQIESDKKVEETEKKRSPTRKIIYKYIYKYVANKEAVIHNNVVYISVIIIAAILAFIIFKSSNPNKQYNGLISSAKTFIESKNWEKASEVLEKAKEIKNTPEIERLFAEIKGKRTEAMKKEFDDLKGFLKGKSSNKDKLEKCWEFLAKHEGIPGNGEKTAIFLFLEINGKRP